MTELIDFVLVVRFPRREFVGLRRRPMPEDPDTFMGLLDEAVSIAEEKHLERYGYRVRYLNLQVQLGHTVISRIKVELGQGSWKIRRWTTAKGTAINELSLAWRYLMRDGELTPNQVAQFVESRDRGNDPGLYLKEKNVEDRVLSVAIKGLPDRESRMRAYAAKSPSFESPVDRKMKAMQARRLRTPITDTR